jgi:hypothetical protein
MFLIPAGRTFFVIAVLLSSTPVTLFASSPRSYLPADDVALGAEAAAEIRANVPTVQDAQLNVFIQELGRRLVDQIPASLTRPAFRYSFEILDQAQERIYGLPGGPVFVSRGLVQAATSETALATAIARQVSHIALRHATAQAAMGNAARLGAVTGRDIGAAIAGPSPHLAGQGAMFSVASYFLLYRNDFEQQADQLARQLLAGAGYDDATNRSSDGFRQAQARLRDMPEPAATGPEPRAVRASRGGVAGPSGTSRALIAGDSLLLSVPANWDRVQAGNTVMIAPEDGFLKTADGTLTLTHGVQVGVARSLTGDLQRDMQALLETLARAGRNVRWRPTYQSTMMAGRKALTTALTNVSIATGGFEQVFIYTGHLPDGNMIYLIGLSPLNESGTYRPVFDRVRESITLVQ